MTIILFSPVSGGRLKDGSNVEYGIVSGYHSESGSGSAVIHNE